MKPHGVTHAMVVEQAVSFAKQLGWEIEPLDCEVSSSANTPGPMASAQDRWKVLMAAQPMRNPRLRTPMPLSCSIEWLGGRLCATQFYEPSDRARYLKDQKGPEGAVR